MTDLMEDRLSAAARRWQAEQPAPPGVPLERLDERLPGSVPWRPLVAAAAAVVVIGGGIVAVTSLGGDSSGVLPPADQGTSASSPPLTRQARPPVPWRNLPAAHPDVRHREHGQVVTPFDHVAATGTISGNLSPGDTLTFTAVLESSTDLPLDPCPDFTIAFGRHFWHSWQLNCVQVPYRDGKGRPLLPAFRNVRFEMKVKVPQGHGDQKVLWTLDGPQQMPGFYGIVHVRPRPTG